jgi:hypothetical protein
MNPVFFNAVSTLQSSNSRGSQSFTVYSTPIYQVIIESSTVMKYKQFINYCQMTQEVICYRVAQSIANVQFLPTLHASLLR